MLWKQAAKQMAYVQRFGVQARSAFPQNLWITGVVDGIGLGDPVHRVIGPI